MAEVPPCVWKTREQETHIGTYLLSACPVLGVIRSRGTERMGHSPCSQGTPSHWERCGLPSSSELKTRLLPSLELWDGADVSLV